VHGTEEGNGKVGVIKVFINGIVSNILPKKILKSTIPAVTK